METGRKFLQESPLPRTLAVRFTVNPPEPIFLIEQRTNQPLFPLFTVLCSHIMSTSILGSPCSPSFVSFEQGLGCQIGRSWFLLDDLIRFCSLSALLRGVVRYHFVYFLEPWLALLHSSIFFRLLSPAWPAFSCSRPSSFMFCFSKCYINSAMTSLSSSVQDSPIFSAWWFNQRSLPVGSSAHVSPVRLDYPEQREDPDTKCDELIIDRNNSNDIFDC